MKVINIGDRVMVLDDTIEGIVTAVNLDQVTIETQDGFLMSYTKKELVVITDSTPFTVSNYEVSKIKASKEPVKKKKAY